MKDDGGFVWETAMSESPGRFGRLYQGLTTFNFVGRRKWWFTVSVLVIVAAALMLWNFWSHSGYGD